MRFAKCISETPAHCSVQIVCVIIIYNYFDACCRVQTLGLAVEDVLQKWVSEGAALFVSTDALLEALLAQISSNNPAEGTVAGVVDNRFENMKRLIDTFLLAAKRITYPPLPMEVWTQNINVSFEKYSEVFPFAPAWVQCLPVAFQGGSFLFIFFCHVFIHLKLILIVCHRY